jgi:hypothetical protein
VTRHQTDPINRILIEHIETIAGKRLRTSGYVLARPSGRQSPERAVRGEII